MFLKKRAFTFFELIIVVLIVGIVLAIVIPAFTQTYEQYKLRSFSKQLQTFLNFINERAVIERRVFLFALDNGQKRYYAMLANTTESQEYIGYTRIPQDLTVSVDAEEEDILFYPDGEITDFEINITNKKEKSILLSTEGVSGFIKLYEEK